MDAELTYGMRLQCGKRCRELRVAFGVHHKEQHGGEDPRQACHARLREREFN